MTHSHDEAPRTELESLSAPPFDAWTTPPTPAPKSRPDWLPKVVIAAVAVLGIAAAFGRGYFLKDDRKAERDELRAVGGVLERFGTSVTARPGAVAVRLAGGADQLAEIVRALDAEDLALADFRLHAPTLDDVFLAKTGRKMEGGEPAEPEAVPA